MVLSGIFILDMKGKVLISRNYRGDIENNVIEKFIGLVMDKEEDGTLTPLLQTGESPDVTFAHIRRNNLYLVATTKKIQTLP
jgi:AP-1 complex subunit mu